MWNRKNIMKEMGVLLFAIIIITSLVTHATAICMDSSAVSSLENSGKTSLTMLYVLLDEDFTPFGVFPPAGWETDCWTQSNTNEAGGTPPEALVYKYDQYYQGQYYDNYIMTPTLDASSCDKVILEFKFAADLYYPGYCSFYVKYRNDASSPWVDITPWGNPLTGNFDGSYMRIINCGSGGCGTAFQVKWEYLGYYYYYNYFYLDDVKISCCDSNNLPPTPPIVTGPIKGVPGTLYTYTFTSTDPEGGLLSYYVDWDDGTPTSWSALQPSGVPYTASHSWSAKGTYTIEAKAKDICGLVSTIGSLKVTMPRDRAINTPFLQFLENHLNMFPILQQLFQRLGLQ